MNRSATTELDLEAGQYLVMIKITASRNKSITTPEEIVKKTCQTRPEKLMAVGLSYDLAHAKGHLRDSELERKERLHRERRDKRRLNAKKVFEAQRKAQKKEKLRRLRMEAKEKAKRGIQAEDDRDAENGVEISIKMGNSTLKTVKRQSVDDAVGGSKVVSREGTSKELKIIVEASDKIKSTGGSDQITSGEIEQPIESGDKKADDAKQAREGTKDEPKGESKKGDGNKFKGISATESGQESSNSRSTLTPSASGLAPATSLESRAATEDRNKAEAEPSIKLDESAATSGKVTDTKVATEIAGNADQSNVVETNIQFQDLTLDNISDDGLSWNSDIDAPSDSPSETDSDSDSDTDTDTDTGADAPASSSTKDQAADDPADDPWNAVCVFGLLVYSKGSQAEIEVVGQQDGEDSSVGNRKLDVDDRAADATKKLQKGSKGDEQRLDTVGIEPAWDEESRQG